MPFRAERLSLSGEEHQELQRMSLSRSLPAGDVFRARLILMLAEGRSYTEVQKRLNTTAPTISKWRKRFLEQRVDGLMQERHPGQKPTVITPQLQARVLAATRRKPSDGSTHWSCRPVIARLLVGMVLGLGAASVLRGLLYGLHLMDGVSLIGVSLLFLVIRMIAAY